MEAEEKSAIVPDQNSQRVFRMLQCPNTDAHRCVGAIAPLRPTEMIKDGPRDEVGLTGEA